MGGVPLSCDLSCSTTPPSPPVLCTPALGPSCHFCPPRGRPTVATLRPAGDQGRLTLEVSAGSSQARVCWGLFPRSCVNTARGGSCPGCLGTPTRMTCGPWSLHGWGTQTRENGKAEAWCSPRFSLLVTSGTLFLISAAAWLNSAPTGGEVRSGIFSAETAPPAASGRQERGGWAGPWGPCVGVGGAPVAANTPLPILWGADRVAGCAGWALPTAPGSGALPIALHVREFVRVCGGQGWVGRSRVIPSFPVHGSGSLLGCL